MLGELIIQLGNKSAQPDDYRELWGNGDAFEAVVRPFLDLMGPVFPLVVALSISGILFVYSGGAALPIVTLIIIGGSLIPYLPPEGQTAALILILLGVAWALYSAWVNGGQRL